MPNFAFPLLKPSMSLEHAIAQTIAHCKAGHWHEAESLYHALKQSQMASSQGQYWLSYIDALIQAGKPLLAELPVSMQVVQVVQDGTQEIVKAVKAVKAEVEVLEEVKEAEKADKPAQEISVSIKLARQPNPSYTARRPRWPWKMALGNGHVPARQQVFLLLAHYQGRRYEQAEILARSLTHVFPHHDLGWKVLVAALQMQGLMHEAQQAQEQRRISRAVRRRNRLPT
ncbi:MAG: hypothetical protein ACOH2K_16550 [Burkholderiaceae bacterium]